MERVHQQRRVEVPQSIVASRAESDPECLVRVVVRISIRIRRSLEWFTVHHLLGGSSLSIVILEGVAVVAPQQSKTLLSSRDSSGLTRW